jgi:hypothetical protein
LNELDGIDAYFPLSDTTPSVLELNDAWQQQLKNRKLQETNKKYSLQSLATATQIRQKNLGQKAKTRLITQAQVNAYESLFQTLTQKNGLREDLPGNGMPMIITNAKK